MNVKDFAQKRWQQWSLFLLDIVKIAEPVLNTRSQCNEVCKNDLARLLHLQIAQQLLDVGEKEHQHAWILLSRDGRAYPVLSLMQDLCLAVAILGDGKTTCRAYTVWGRWCCVWNWSIINGRRTKDV